MDEFSKAVKKEKLTNIGNLSSISEGKINPDKAIKYFSKRDINEKEIQRFLEFKGISKNLIEGHFPYLSLKNSKNEIVGEITKMGPFKTPEDLSEKIAFYIKSNMKYDTLVLLNGFAGLLEGFGNENNGNIDNNIEEISLLLKSIGIILKDNELGELSKLKEDKIFDWIMLKTSKILSNNSYSFSSEWLMESKKKILKRINSIKLNEKSKLDIENLVNNMSSPEQFNNYIKNNWNKDFLKFLDGTFVVFDLYDISSNNKDGEIFNLLKNIKIGTCRNFSMTAKIIYNEMAKDLFPKSSMLYVLTPDLEHAYNILEYKGENGLIKKIELDITDFIVNPEAELFKNEKLKKGSILSQISSHDNQVET